jgi:anti-anti-sigma factor
MSRAAATVLSHAEFLTITAQPISSGAAVIAARGEVDWCTSPLLRGALLAQLRPTGPQLVIDFTDVRFFGAAGLTVLVTVRDTRTSPTCRPSRVTYRVGRPCAIVGSSRSCPPSRMVSRSRCLPGCVRHACRRYLSVESVRADAGVLCWRQPRAS